MRNDGASFCFCVRTNDAKKYNEHLATTSWTLAFAGTYLRKFDVPDSQGNTYYNKHAGARQFLADIGCPDQSIYVNDSMVSKPGTDTVGCTIGSKELAKADGTKTGKILIPVTVRGGGYESEWASNCTLGAGTPDEGRNGEAKGFSTAADQVVDAIDQYINKYELEDEIHDGKVVFWVSGFSRAGATANITSKKLKKKNVRVKVSKCIRFVKKAQGTKSYKLISAKKGKKSFKKKFSVNAKTGKLTVKKK